MVFNIHLQRRFYPNIEVMLRYTQRLLHRTYSNAGFSGLFILYGALLRLSLYLSNRSLWIDEAMLAYSILHRTFSGLMSPLSYNQVAPPGFLILEKLAVLLFGDSEYALRLFPLLAGILSLFLFYRVARCFLIPRGAQIALMLMATNSYLVYYAAEVKQYSSDVLMTVLLYFSLGNIPSCFSSSLEEAGSSPVSQGGVGSVKNILCFNLTGILGLWLSQASAFIYLGILLPWLMSLFLQKQWRCLLILSLGFLIWIVNLLTLNVLFLQPLAHDPLRMQIWEEVWNRHFHAFMPNPLDIGQWLAWVRIKWDNWRMAGLGLIFSTIIVPFLFLVGVFTYAGRVGHEPESFPEMKVLPWTAPGRDNILAFWMLILPVLLVLIASAMHGYPFHERLLLFLLPNVLLILSAGIVRTFQKITHQLQKILPSPLPSPLAPTLMILFCVIVFLTAHPLHPRFDESIKPVMQSVNRLERPGDVLYVFPRAQPAFSYYLNRFERIQQNKILCESYQSFMQDKASFLGLSGGQTEKAQFKIIDTWRNSKQRVWVLFSHVHRSRQFNEEENYIKHLDRNGVRLTAIHASGASAYLYYFF